MCPFSAIYLSDVNEISNVPDFPTEEKKMKKRVSQSWALAAQLQRAGGTKSWEGRGKTSGNAQETGKAVGEGTMRQQEEWEQKGIKSGKLKRNPVGENFFVWRREQRGRIDDGRSLAAWLEEICYSYPLSVCTKERGNKYTEGTDLHGQRNMLRLLCCSDCDNSLCHLPPIPTLHSLRTKKKEKKV